MPGGKHSKTSRNLWNVRVQLKTGKARGCGQRVLQPNEVARLQKECEALVLELAEKAKERKAARAQPTAASRHREVPVECEHIADGQDDEEIAQARGSVLAGSPSASLHAEGARRSGRSGRSGRSEAPRTERHDNTARKGNGRRKGEECTTDVSSRLHRPHPAEDASNALRALVRNFVEEALRTRAQREEDGPIGMELQEDDEDDEGDEDDEDDEDEGCFADEEDDHEDGGGDGGAVRVATEGKRRLMEQVVLFLTLVYFRIRGN